MEFHGFSPETMDFLWGIRFNNNREWFAAHKEQYRRALYEPMKALAKALEPELTAVPDLRLHLSRIYRDMRMHPTTFYKDSLWFQFQRPHSGGVLENPCLCFELRPEGYRYGFLIGCARAQQMALLRTRIAEHAQTFSRLVAQAEKKTGVLLEGELYARPKPCDDPRIARFFAMKNMVALRDCPPDELLFSEALFDEVRRSFLAWLPVCDFLQL